MPGRRSTPELTSTMSGRTRATAAATVSGVSPPASTIAPAAEPRPGLAREHEVQRDAATAGDVRHPWLDQHGVRVHRGLAQEAEVFGAGQTRHPPDAQSFGAKPRRVLAPIGPVKLGAGERGRAADAEDLVDRLFAEDAEDGHDARGRATSAAAWAVTCLGPPAKTTPR